MATFALGSPALSIGAPTGPIGWYHLAMFGVVMPYAAIRTRARMKALDRLPSVSSWLIRSLVLIVAAGALSLITARMQWISLGRWVVPEPLHLLLGAMLLLAFVMLIRPQWRKAVAENSPGAYFKMPRTGTERALWVAASVGAGVFEEITWRGVQVTLLTSVTGNAWLAALLSAVMFAAAHAIQNLKSIAFIFGFSLIMSTLVAVTGSLILPMLIHTTYDIIAGFSYAKFGRELGYQPPLPAADAPGAEETGS